MMKQQTQPVRKRKRTDKEDESKTAVSSAEEASEIAKCIVDGGTKWESTHLFYYFWHYQKFRNANRIILLLNTIESNDTKEDTMLASVKGVFVILITACLSYKSLRISKSIPVL